MKFLSGLIATIFAVGAYAQDSYGVGSVGDLNLPSGSRGSSSSSFSSTSFSSSSSSGGSVSVPTFPKADLSVVGGSGMGGSSFVTLANGQIYDTGSAQNAALITARSQIGTPVRSINSVFSRFPSTLEVARMADEGDIAGITKLLQVVAADDSVPCATKITYLMDLLGQVRDAIRRKTGIADQLQAVIDGAKTEITRLTAQINKVTSDRNNLNIPALDSRVADLSARLTDLYSRINAVKTQIGPEQARITGYERELQTLIRQNDDERSKITNDKLKLASTDSLIRDLEGKLQEARDAKTTIQTTITTSQTTVRDNQRKADTIRASINDVNAKIKGLQDNIDNLRRQTNTLEVDLERARTDSNVAKANDNTLNDQIAVLQRQLAEQQPRTDDTPLRNLRAIIANLNRVLPNINNDINREYYYCYGAGKVETLTVGATVVYVVRGEAFGEYLSRAYGQNVGAPLVSSGTDYRLQVVDPFSQIWTAKFGYPSFVAGSVGGAGGAVGTASCLGGGLLGSAGSSGSSGLGVIANITSDGIQVRNSKGELVNLSIGGCSRLESTSSLPSVGQNIAWRGTPSSAGGYSIYGATCW